MRFMKASLLGLIIATEVAAEGRLRMRQGSSGDTLSNERRVSVSSFVDVDEGTDSPINHFKPLSCNSQLATLPCSTPLSSITEVDGNGMKIIVCGTCAYLDVLDGSTLEIANGINVEGKLHVKPDASGTLNTTAVVVQGELQIDAPSTGNKVTFNLFGINDINFYPNIENALAEDNNASTPVALGKKPIAVVGGKLNVNALSNSGCPSWVKLKSKGESTPATATDFVQGGGDGNSEEAVAPFKGVSSHNMRYPDTDVVTVEEDGNLFYRIKASVSTASSGLRFRLATGNLRDSLDVGETLAIKYRYRVNIPEGSDQSWIGKPLLRWAKYSRPKGTLWASTCSEASTGNWVECTSEFKVAAGMKTSDYWWDVTFAWEGGSRMSGNDIDFDDIKVERLGKTIFCPDVLYVGTQAAECWNVGDDILVTSSGPSTGEVVRTAIATDPSKGTITLESCIHPLENILVSEDEYGQDGKDFAVEVASLSRRVAFQAEPDDPNPLHGGHLIVRHTRGVAQTLTGIEIDNFGQSGIQGTYPIHMHVSENVEGTLISKNVIRSSNQRCVVIHGTHNTTVSDNVVYEALGHCYMLEDGGEWNNRFEHNLGCRVSQHPVEASWTRSDVGEPAVFLVTNPANIFVNNVATGSNGHGIWIETLKRVIGPSAELPINQGHNPRGQRLYEFRGNVAHSNSMHGVTTAGHAYWYRTGYHPSAEFGHSVLKDTKSYMNRFDCIRLWSASNILIEGGYLSDCDRCIDVGLGSPNVEIRNLRCTALSEHKRAADPNQCQWSWDRSNPEPGFAGISVTINEKGKEAKLSGVNFTGFYDLDHCWGGKGTAFHILDDGRLNNKDWDGVPQLNGGFSVDGPAMDIKCEWLDWSKTDSGGISEFKNVYVNDIDGSMGGTGNGGAFFVQETRDPAAVAFVDLSRCEHFSYTDSCGMYCDGPCMRTVKVQNHADFEDTVMIVSNGTYEYTYTRILGTDGKNFEAALPTGQYTITFQDTAGNPSWPGYGKMALGREPSCMNHVTEADVSLLVPDTIGSGMCSSMSKNGDFQAGTRQGWSAAWFGWSILSETNSTNYYLETSNRKLTRSAIYTWVDRSCVKGGKTYHIKGRMRLKDGSGNEKGCDISLGYPAGCPIVELRLFDADVHAPIRNYAMGSVDIIGDGSWATFDWHFTLPDEDLPDEAYKAIVMFRGSKSSNFLIDDFNMAYV